MTQDDVVGRALYELLPLMGRLFAASARRGGLSIDRLKSLRILGLCAPVRAGELAERCSLTPAAVTHFTDGLVAEGLVRREEDPADRRAVLLDLTPKGRRELARVEVLAVAELVRRVERLDPETRAQLARALPKLNDVLAEREGEEWKVSHVR